MYQICYLNISQANELSAEKTYLCKPGFNSQIFLVQRRKRPVLSFSQISKSMNFESTWIILNYVYFFFQIRDFSFIKIIGFDATLLFHLYTMWLSVCIFGQNWFSTGQTVTIQLLWSFSLFNTWPSRLRSNRKCKYWLSSIEQKKLSKSWKTYLEEFLQV